MDDAGGLEHRRPRLHGLVVHAHRPGDVARVEQLPRARRAGDHEAVEPRLVLHVHEIAHVALEVGAHVVGVEGVPLDARVLELWHAPPVDDLPDALGCRRHVGRLELCWHVSARCRSDAGNLAQGEPRHLDDADAAGERLAHAFHQVVGLRPGEHDGALLVGFVHEELHGGEQLRRLLHFVDDDRQLVAAEEQQRVLGCLQERRGVFHGHVVVAAPQMVPEHRGLADLPCTRDEHDLALPEHAVDGAFHLAFDIHERLLSFR